MKKPFFFSLTAMNSWKPRLLPQIYRSDQLIENLKKCLRRGEGHEDLTDPCNSRIAFLYEVFEDDEFGPGLPGKGERR